MNVNVSNVVNSVFSRKNVNENVSNTEKQNAAPKTIESNVKEQDSAKEAVFGKVIGVSDNGDVASAREESMKALDDGMVFKKAEDKSLVGFTEDQLQQLYQKGDIDKFKYDQEIERRAQIRKEDPEEAKAEEKKAETKKEEVKADNKKVEAKKADAKVEAKKADAKAEAKKADAKVEAKDEKVAPKEDEKKDENDNPYLSKDEPKENPKAEENSNTKIAQDMAKLFADKQEQTLKANAVKDAIANDRADLIADVFAKNN